MNLFKNFFNKSPTGTRMKMITQNGNGFYSWNGSLYESDVVRSCIRPKTKAIGKLLPKHTRESAKGLLINPEPYMKMLLKEPNPHMTMQVLLEKVTTQLSLNNNAFIFIARNEFGYPVELYPIPCLFCEAIYDEFGELFLKFTMRNGKNYTFRYSDIIHIRDDFNDNDLFGESPTKAITQLMNIITTTDQGIVNAIKNSGIIRWILVFKAALRPEDIRLATKEFVDNYLSYDSETAGAVAADAKYDLKQVEQKDYVPNAAQMDKTTIRLYNFFNTNEKIVQSKFDENEWNAYYESQVEPLAMQLSAEFSRKLFTKRERGFGNEIVFAASNLQYASMRTKLDLVQMVDRGAMTPNEWREILGLGPIELGDKPIRRLDTAVVEGGDTSEES